MYMTMTFPKCLKCSYSWVTITGHLTIKITLLIYAQKPINLLSLVFYQLSTCHFIAVIKSPVIWQICRESRFAFMRRALIIKCLYIHYMSQSRQRIDLYMLSLCAQKSSWALRYGDDNGTMTSFTALYPGMSAIFIAFLIKSVFALSFHTSLV